MSALNDFKTDFVTSADGTQIGYRRIGEGPGVVMVHGGLQSSLNFTKLAKVLANDFTVYIPDRRGRGLSGAYGNNDHLETEANDMLALTRYTGTQYIFGLSSGAIITLKAALMEPALKKVALYEPPIPANGDVFKKLFVAYENAMRKENLGKAFIALIKGTGDTGDRSLLSMLPGFITAPVINVLMKAQMKNKNENEIPLQQLIPTFQHDRIVVGESEPLIEQAKNIRADILLLGGSKSRPYLKQALDRLQSSISHAKRVEFEKMGHLAADNSGNPQKVGNELISFFNS